MKKIIPAIDLYNEQVVRLYQGNFQKINYYSKNPIKIAESFCQQGATHLHVINLNGAKFGEFENTPNFDVILSLSELCNNWDCKIQVGGGIRKEKTIKNLLNRGVNNVIIGTIAVENLELTQKLVKKFQDEIIVSLDVMDNNVMIKGWQSNTRVSLNTMLKKLEEIGISHFIITDISRDGTSIGPNIELYKELVSLKERDSEIIASGGIRTKKDVESVLNYSNGIIIGEALYRNRILENEFRSLIIKYNPTNLTKRIIPCLDIKDGRVVKGVKFKDLRDSGDPVVLSKFYNQEGADELIFLDVSATLEGRQIMMETLKSVAENINIPFSVGGGISDLNEMTQIIKAGAEKVCINTAAVKDPSLINKGSLKFGTQSIVLAIDAKKTETNWEVYIKSGTEPTGLDVLNWAKEAVRRGAGEILLTSMDKDGTKSGYDLDLIQMLSNSLHIPIIASGGAGDYNHFFQAINVGAEAVLAASLFHYKIMSIRDLKIYLRKRKIRVRV